MHVMSWDQLSMPLELRGKKCLSAVLNSLSFPHLFLFFLMHTTPTFRCRARYYSYMMEDLQAIYQRLSPLMDEYQKNAMEDRELTVSFKP